VLFTVYVNDLILKLIDANLGCRTVDMSISCLFYGDDIVLLTSFNFTSKVLIDGHCLHHLLPPVKTLSIQLRPASHC